MAPTPLPQEAIGRSSDDLDAIFGSSPAGSIPRGRGRGTALVATGTRFGRVIANLGGLFWQGKAFNPVRDEAVNLLTPIDLRGFRAAVREEPSRVDGRPCVVLDYSTSRLAGFVRDEIREVSPGEYLGVVYVANKKMPVHFWLTFPAAH